MVQSLDDNTGEKSHELMVLINKMRKGETIPEEMRKYYIVKEEEGALLDTLRKNLRKILDTQKIWCLKRSIDLTAESETE